ncbi:MAG: HEAT repeat domain-containing protein, partial [Planctomycetaceae bacterium]|nr:HEAT repeat domain-containing protein [Planctomycetaceae bacterium]
AREQLDRLLRADAADADATSHRLARLGAALQPEVYARLKTAATDRDRRRLMVLRYRLVADTALAIGWPGGIERLADSNPRTREKAADELAKRAAEADQPLLLELFADPDPLVREISLRGLQHIGGKQSNAALVKLLDDPDPNVRAAVLKQLEAAPGAAMMPAIIKYVKREKDADLIGHGIRVLQGGKGPDATKCLMGLLKHEAWQVRAEAAVAIGKVIGGNQPHFYRSTSFGTVTRTEDLGAALTADVYVALLDLLDDPEPFVVAKSVEGLAGADMAVAVEPLARAATKHPDLAPTILSMLARGSTMRPKAMPHLQKFIKHKDAQIRAAAVTAICSISLDDAEEAVLAGLADKQAVVRLAAAAAAFQAMDTLRDAATNKHREDAQRAVRIIAGSPSATVGVDLLSTVAKLLGGSAKPAETKVAKDEKPSTRKPAAKATKTDKLSNGKPSDKEDAKIAKPANAKPAHEDSWWDQWLVDCYAGRNRPKWTAHMVPLLAKMLKAETPKERVAAAFLLIPLGKASDALPVIQENVRTNPELLEPAAKALPWLLWEDRVKAFRSFRSSAASDEAITELAGGISSVPDPRAADLFWELLADPKINAEVASGLSYYLAAAYVGERYVSSDVPAAVRRRAVESAKPHTRSGSDWQRRVALAVLTSVAKDEAAETAASLAADKSVSDAVRLEAYQVQLAAQSDADARKSALATLRANDPKRRPIALRYLAHGQNALSTLPSGLRLSYSVSYSSSDHPIVPQPPAGLKIEDVRGLLRDPDPETAANAGYLAVLLGDADGMTPLLKYWRGERPTSDHWPKSVYRAIAVADDPKYIPILRDIYAKLQSYEMSEFYWTIRIMSGEEILKFRKEVRDAMKESNSF